MDMGTPPGLSTCHPARTCFFVSGKLWKSVFQLARELCPASICVGRTVEPLTILKLARPRACARV